MSARPVLSTAVAVLVGFSSTVSGMPTADSAKSADPSLPGQSAAKFSTLHGDMERPSSSGGFGIEEPRRILKDAFRSCPAFPDSGRAHHFLAAARHAASVCNDSTPQYRRLLEVLIASGEAEIAYGAPRQNWLDAAAALENGVSYLVNEMGGPSLCQGLLSMGLWMTRPAMTSCERSYTLLYSVFPAAIEAARQEHPQWSELLAFTKDAAEQCKNWRNSYRVTERIADTVANAKDGQDVYRAALTAIAKSDINLYSPEDYCNVLREGFRGCPSPTPLQSGPQCGPAEPKTPGN